MPNALVPNPLPPAPAAVKTAPTLQSVAADFRLALAVAAPGIPAPGDAAPKPAAATALAPVIAGAADADADAEAVIPQTDVKKSDPLAAAGDKNVKKKSGQKPAAATAAATAQALPAMTIATGPASAVAVSAVAVSAVAVSAVAVSAVATSAATVSAAPIAAEAVTPAVSAPSLAVPHPQAAPIAAGPQKAEPAIAATATKPNLPIPAFAGNAAPILPPAISVTPAHAAQNPAKIADITKQLAAALPRSSLAGPIANPALHISLTPETLGTITVKIIQHASGETTVTLTASQPETLAALKHDAPNLNQILTNAGVPESNRQMDFQTLPVAAPQISAGLGNAGQQGQSGNNGQASQQPGMAFASTVANPVANPAPAATASPLATLQPQFTRDSVNVIA